MFDLNKIQIQANAYASTLGCKVLRVCHEDEALVMIDEEGEKVGQVTVKDGGVYNGKQMMIVTDDDGPFFVEAFGQILAKTMWC